MKSGADRPLLNRPLLAVVAVLALASVRTPLTQVAAGTPRAQPPIVMREQICRRDLPRESWTTVQVRLNPAHDASGRVALSGWQLRPAVAGCGITISPNPYRGFRFPPVVIEHAVWLYHCFSLSLRDVG